MCAMPYTTAFQTYEEACSRADSHAGDDLGGLLYDWGCGLCVSAQNLVDSAAVNAAAARAAAAAGMEAASVGRCKLTPCWPRLTPV